MAGHLWSEGLFLLIIFTGAPSQVVGTTMPSMVPSRILFFLLSEEYLEKNQQSPPSPRCYLTGIIKWGGDIEAAKVVRTIWLQHLSLHEFQGLIQVTWLTSPHFPFSSHLSL